MTRLIWFIIGLLTGEVLLSWAPHVIYVSIIIALLVGRHYFSCAA